MRNEHDVIEELRRAGNGPAPADRLAELLARATARGRDARMPYAGAFTPEEAYEAMRLPGVRMIDVRSRAEWAWVGRVPDSHLVPWAHYEGGSLRPNPRFVDELAEVAGRDEVVLFLCRSAKRSKPAAVAATQAGYTQAFDILEGFEGDADLEGRRNTINGWRHRGLPWRQE